MGEDEEGKVDANEAEVDGVLVVRRQVEGGGVVVDLTTLGGVQTAEIQTLLEIGIKTVRGRLGLPSL